MSRKKIEIILQRSLLQYLGKSYFALVSVIKTMWIEEIINLFDTILRIIRHAKINKENEEDMTGNASKVLATRTPQMPRETCITQKCIDQGITTHFSD